MWWAILLGVWLASIFTINVIIKPAVAGLLVWLSVCHFASHGVALPWLLQFAVVGSPATDAAVAYAAGQFPLPKPTFFYVFQLMNKLTTSIFISIVSTIHHQTMIPLFYVAVTVTFAFFVVQALLLGWDTVLMLAMVRHVYSTSVCMIAMSVAAIAYTFNQESMKIPETAHTTLVATL